MPPMRTIQHARRHSSERARRLAETLAWLRLSAVAGQSLTVILVALALRLSIHVGPLALGIGALAAFAGFVFWRLRRWPQVGVIEAFGHVVFDLTVLAWLLYWSGGAGNPFSALLVIPIALAAAALPALYTVAIALLASACYVLLIPLHVPLPPLPAGPGGLDLHMAGSLINFAIIAAMLAFYISRLARRLRNSELEFRRERERGLRDEGILAIATQAAGTAHELNTPLSTIRTLLTELRREQTDNPALVADLDLLAGQADRCRDILGELVAIGRRQLAGSPQQIGLDRFIADCLNQFRLLRPEVELHTRSDPAVAARRIDVLPSLNHALINLLSNAADASLAAGRQAIELAVTAAGAGVEFRIRDHGSGIAPGEGTAFRTGKRDGLGLGLALAHATAERLGGELIAAPAEGGGLLQRLRLPLPAAENPGS